MISQWTHLVTPGEFDKQPHLYCAGITTENTPAYNMVWNGPGPRCVLQYTLEGYGMITYRGTTYSVEQGHAFVFPQSVPSTRYFYPPGATEPWQFVFCEFYHLDDAVEQLNSRHGPVYEFGNGWPTIQKLLNLLTRQQQRETMISGPESFRFCAEIIEEMDRIVEAKDRGENGSLAIKARDLVFQRRMESFSLSELAGSMGITPEHLCREFRRHLNISPKQYHDQLRVHMMQERLIGSSFSIKEIAHEFGFASPSNFIAFFKKQSGFTPGEIRNRQKAVYS